MGKGDYHGGGTIVLKGTISKSKGRRSGFGSTKEILEARRKKAFEQKRQAAARIKANEKLLRKIGKEMAAQKRREELAKGSSLAEALYEALNAKPK